MGYGDDGGIDETRDISLQAFAGLLKYNALNELAKYNPNLKRKYNFPYVESDVLLPCVYHLQILELFSVCPQSRLLCGQTLHFLA
jgi:hypothetical protein